jgi:histidyl-tRNA synthetase
VPLPGGTAPDPAFAAAVGQLAEILALAGATSAGRHLRIDPSLARGLSYYTGAIMEIAVADLAGSLGGGGRYDGLVGMFLGEDVPACGFSLGLERILVVMSERGMFPAAVGAVHADALVTLWNAEGAPAALALARDLRAAGLRVDVYPEPDKLGKQFKYAAARGVPLVLVEGDDERARGEVTVKAMSTGEQRSVPRAELAAWLGRPS